MSEEATYPNAIQAFYYERLKWCGCGSPDEALSFMRDFLGLMKVRSDENRTGSDTWAVRSKEIDAVLGDGALGLSYLYMLDAHGLTEHGGSVYGSWLTDDGEAVLATLRSIDDLDWAMRQDFGPAVPPAPDREG